MACEIWTNHSVTLETAAWISICSSLIVDLWCLASQLLCKKCATVLFQATHFIHRWTLIVKMHQCVDAWLRFITSGYNCKWQSPYFWHAHEYMGILQAVILVKSTTLHNFLSKGLQACLLLFVDVGALGLLLSARPHEKCSMIILGELFVSVDNACLTLRSFVSERPSSSVQAVKHYSVI